MDYLDYVLNFPGFELLATESRQWSIYLRRPCSKLSPETLRCSIHGKPEYPDVCRRYNPYNCFYKPVISEAEPERHGVRFDRDRFDQVLARCQIDERGIVVAIPSRAGQQA